MCKKKQIHTKSFYLPLFFTETVAFQKPVLKNLQTRIKLSKSLYAMQKVF